MNGEYFILRRVCLAILANPDASEDPFGDRNHFNLYEDNMINRVADDLFYAGPGKPTHTDIATEILVRIGRKDQ